MNNENTEEDIKRFLNSDKWMQIYMLRLNPELFDIFKDYILQNLLQDLAIEVFDDRFPYFFEKMPTDIQRDIIIRNTELFDRLEDSKKIKLLMELKDRKVAEQLMNDYKLSESVSFMEVGDMFDFLNLLSFDEFKKYIDTPDILNSIISQTTGFLTPKSASDLFAPEIIKKLSEEKIEYFFSKLIETGHEEIVKFYIKETSVNIKRKFEPDSLSVVIEEILNGDVSKLNELVQRVNNKTEEKDIFSILSLYPDIIDEKNLYVILDKIYLIWSKHIIRKSNIFSEQLLLALKKYCLKAVLEGKNINFTPGFIDALSMTEDENKVIFDMFLPEVILKEIGFESVFNYVLSKLKENEHYFSEVDFEKIYIPYLEKERISKIINYFPPNIAIRYLGEDSLDKIIEMIKEDKTLIKFIEDDDVLYAISEDYINNFTLEQLYKLYVNYSRRKKYEGLYIQLDELEGKDSKSIDLESLFQFIITKLNKEKGNSNLSIYSTSVGQFYEELSEEQRKIFIGNLCMKDYIVLFDRKEKDKVLWEFLLENVNEIFSSDIIDYSTFYERFDNEQIRQLIEKLNNESLTNLFMRFNSKYIEEEVYKRFRKDVGIFCTSDADIFFGKMRVNHKQEISAKLNEKMNEIGNLYPEIYSLINDKEDVTNFTLIKINENGMLSNEIIKERYIYLLKNNKYVNRTLDYMFLTEEYFINYHFLEKISRYPLLEKEIIRLNNQSKEQFKIFKQIGNYISINDLDDKIFDKKILLILNEFKNNEYSFDHELNDEEIQNLERYILHKSTILKFTAKEPLEENIDILNYSSSIIEICDSKYNPNIDIEEKKNLILKKYFDISKNEAEIFLKMYDNKLEELDLEEDAITFVKNIKEILKFSSEELDEFYQTNDVFYSIDDLFYIENVIQIACTKDFKNNMFADVIPNRIIQIDGQEIKVIEPKGNFSLLIHSTNAYRQMRMINDNYYDSWNSSKNTNNHGICTALVSDSSLGFPPLGEDIGCIYGFCSFSEKQFGPMAPYDLMSDNSQYTFEARRPSRFSSLQDTLDYTRHTHNEIVLERRNLSDKDGINLQPDYVIITNEFTEQQKRNALKAANEMNNGEGIPIVYIDFEKIISEKKAEIEQEIEEFRTTSNLTILGNIINQYESIECTKYRINNYDFINVTQITEVIDEYIDNNFQNSDKLNMLLSVLKKENEKFELLASDGPRQRYFDINYQKYLQIISNLNEMQSLEGETKNVAR